MSSTKQKFVLVGPHAGRTLSVNGHEFVDGELTFAGSAEQIATLARVFEYYGAVTAESAELQELRAANGITRQALDIALSGLPGDQVDPEYVVASMSAHFGDLFTAEDEAQVRRLVVVQADSDASDTGPDSLGSDSSTSGNNADQNSPTAGPGSIAEAIGVLDPENELHWTSNNLPSLDYLENLLGKKVARGEVDAVAAGYTRAKARAAKQQ